MKALTSSVLAVVLAAAAIAIFPPGVTAGVVLSFGAPFALFANVMATEAPKLDDVSPAHSALLVDWN